MRKMLITSSVILALFLGIGVMTGCDKSASDTVSDAVQTGGEAVGDTAETAGDAVKDAVD